MQITEGISWVMLPTAQYDQTVAFFHNILGLSVMAEGIPVTDIQFTRYAQFTMPNGVVLEVVEPHQDVEQLYQQPILSFTVADLGAACRELEQLQIARVAPMFRTSAGLGWTYIRAPDGQIYQIQGAYNEVNEPSSEA